MTDIGIPQTGANNPRAGSGGVANQPTGPAAVTPTTISTPLDFARALISALGVPDTTANENAIVAWAAAEGGNWHNTASFNPLNTTQDAPGATAMNSVGVKAYTSWQQGLDATVQTLKYGAYSGVIAALKAGTDPYAVAKAVGASPWGTGDFSADIPNAGAYGATTGGPAGGAVNAVGTEAGGASGASGTAPQVPNAPAFSFTTPVPNDPTLDNEILTQFPQFAWAMNDPQIAAILRYAAKYNTGATWVQAWVQQTDWWKKNSDSIKQFQTLQNTDPAEALQQMHNRAATIAQQAKVIGLNIAPDRANQLAQEALQYNWTPEQAQQALYAESQRVTAPPNAAGAPAPALGVTVGATGTADTYAQQATQMAHEYLSNLTPQQAQQIGFQIATGQMDPSALSSMFVGQAKARFKDNPDLMQALDAGITPAQVLSPYQQTIGSLLEVSPDQVNFADPKYAPVLSTKDDRGTNRLMTETEAATWARSQPEWTQTANAKQAASNTAQQVLTDMGAAKY